MTTKTALAASTPDPDDRAPIVFAIDECQELFTTTRRDRSSRRIDTDRLDRHLRQARQARQDRRTALRFAKGPGPARDPLAGEALDGLDRTERARLRFELDRIVCNATAWLDAIDRNPA